MASGPLDSFLRMIDPFFDLIFEYWWVALAILMFVLFFLTGWLQIIMGWVGL